MGSSDPILEKWACLDPIIQRQIDLKWFQGNQDALGHHQRPRQAQPGQVQQVPVMFIKTVNDEFQLLKFFYFFYFPHSLIFPPSSPLPASQQPLRGGCRGGRA